MLSTHISRIGKSHEGNGQNRVALYVVLLPWCARSSGWER